MHLYFYVSVSYGANPFIYIDNNSGIMTTKTRFISYPLWRMVIDAVLVRSQLN